MKTLQNLINEFQGDKVCDQIRLDKWREEFLINPIYSLENSHDRFVDAAELEMAIRMLELIEYGQSRNLTEEEIVVEVIKQAQRELLRLATQNANHSTSQTKNLMDGARVEVYAKFVESLER